MGFDRLVSNQPQYSMLWRVIEELVVPTSSELGVSQIVWSPMAQGVLTGKYLPGQPAPAGSRATDPSGSEYLGELMTDKILTRVQGLLRIADDAGMSMATLAVAWVLQNENVAGAIVGASRPEQLADSVAASGLALQPDVLAAIDEVLGDVVERNPDLTLSPAERPDD
jgi:aryl-alcohol dehydrogenase-like predicted oxidoreductase